MLRRVSQGCKVARLAKICRQSKISGVVILQTGAEVYSARTHGDAFTDVCQARSSLNVTLETRLARYCNALFVEYWLLADSNSVWHRKDRISLQTENKPLGEFCHNRPLSLSPIPVCPSLLQRFLRRARSAQTQLPRNTKVEGKETCLLCGYL